MTSIFDRLEIDYGQWKAVTRTLLRTDFRLPLTDGRSTLGRMSGFVAMALVLSLFGIGAAVVVYAIRDPLLGGSIALIYLGVMLATTLMTQQGLTMLSTADYAILGPRPVSSRTFLAIRVTNVLFHAFVITTLAAYPVVLAYLFAGGVNLPRAIAGVLAIYGWSLTVTLALVASYGAILRVAGATRLKRALGYFQMIGGFLAYGGLFLITRVFSITALAETTLPDEWWLMLVPPAWFASYIELAVGAANSTTAVRAALTIAVLLVLTNVLHRRLGPGYAQHLAELPQEVAGSGDAVTRTPFFARAEPRAVAILVLAHFRHDLRVRMGILAIVPMILLYMFIGRETQTFDLVAFAVLLFPALVTRHFATSETYQASWIFHATPADHARLVVSVKNVAIAYFVLPFLAFVAAVMTWRMGDLPRALIHTAMLGLISHIALQGSIVISPWLPFAHPPEKATGNTSLMLWMAVVIFGGQGALFALDRWVYVSSERVMAAMVLLIGVSWMLNAVIAWRARWLRR